jgi:hypothetical protein
MYTVKLTVDGKSSTLPLTIKMDPRVKTSDAGLQKKLRAESRLASIMSESAQALLQGGSIRAQLEKLTGQATGSAKDALDATGKKLIALLGAAPGFSAPPPTESTLSRLNGQASTLYQQVWQVDAEPTSSQTEALSAVEKDSGDVLKRWNEFKTTDLPALNRQLRESKVPEVQLEANIHQDEPQVDEE